ncbi:DNA-binding transcriptional LysR family regulator [Pseudacidovorax sp. 1753]|uniref:LysR family transcriptional regulator n=1 Tax=Pseudacidovorax sp. 1753 TaxID=3156419 RepID=UPI003393D6AF
MELRQLRALQAIAATGSFGEAAELLGLTQSALSHQVRQLEDELGQTLLIRARPKTYPSPAGEVVLAAAGRIAAEVAALEHRFASARRGPVTGTLRIAATAMSFTYVLGDMCEAFRHAYPQVELVFTAAESAEQAVRRVLSGASDVAFGPLAQQHESLAEVKLARAEHAFVVRQGHPLAGLAQVTPDQLRGFPIALFQPKSGTRSLTDRIFGEHGHPPVLTESNDAQFIKRMVSISDASALMVAYALAADGVTPPLHCLRLASSPLVVDVGLIHRKNVQMNALELFKGLCLDLRGPRPRELRVDEAGRAPAFAAPPGGRSSIA